MDTTKSLRLRAIAVTLGTAALLSTLTGCTVGYTETPTANPSAPVSVEDTRYESTYTKVPGVDFIVTCLDAGIGKSATLSCFKGSQDIPKDRITDFDELRYDASFLKVDGVTVACLDAGIGKSAVVSCFPVEA